MDIILFVCLEGKRKKHKGLPHSVCSEMELDILVLDSHHSTAALNVYML